MKNLVPIINLETGEIEIKDVPCDVQTPMFATKPLYCWPFDPERPEVPDPDEWKEERFVFTTQLICSGQLLLNPTGAPYVIFCDASGDGAKLYITSYFNWVDAVSTE